MPKQSKVIYFLNLKYPEYIKTTALGSEYAHIDIDSPILPMLNIDCVTYRIIDNHIELPSSYEFISSKNYYLYVANISNFDKTLSYNIQISINQHHAYTSDVKIINLATNEEITCSSFELDYLLKLAFINSIGAMKKLYSNFNKSFKTFTMQFHSEIMSFLSASERNHLEKIDSLINSSMQIEAMGGDEFTAILLKIKNSLQLDKTKNSLKEDDLDEDYIFVETSSSEQEKNKKLLALSKKIALQAQFKQNIDALNSIHLSLRENHKNIDASSATEYASLATILLKQALLDEITIDLVDLNVIYIAHKEGGIFCTNLLFQALSQTGEATIDERLFSYMQTTKIDSLLYLLNNGFNSSFCLLIDALDIPLNFIEFNHVDFEQPISLLELTAITQNQICFLKLLRAGSEPMFITSNSRVLLHDIFQAYPVIANALISAYISKPKQESFFRSLIVITKSWSHTFSVDKVEMDELDLKIAAYDANIYAEDITCMDKDLSYFDSVTHQILEITGLTKLMLNSLRPIKAFQNIFIEFNLAYQNYIEILQDPDMQRLKYDSTHELLSLIAQMHKKPCITSKQTPEMIIQNLHKDIELFNIAIEIIHLDKHYHEACLKQTNKKHKKQMKPIKEASDNVERKIEEFSAICNIRFADQALTRFSMASIVTGLSGLFFSTTPQMMAIASNAKTKKNSTDRSLDSVDESAMGMHFDSI
jgi:hypothetical protein